jgi:tetratricopeptide (TPR) repeat protein
MAYLKAETGENLELALSEVKRALATKEAGYLLDTLGWVYYKLGRFEEGRQPLEKALRLRPDDTVILEHLGDLYRALSLWQLAGEVYRRVLELDPLAEGIQEKLDSIPEEQRQ